MELDLLNTLLSSDIGKYVVAGLSVLGGIVTIASAIAPFTSTPKDDEAVAWAKSLLQRFSVIKPKA